MDPAKKAEVSEKAIRRTLDRSNEFVSILSRLVPEVASLPADALLKIKMFALLMESRAFRVGMSAAVSGALEALSKYHQHTLTMVPDDGTAERLFGHFVDLLVAHSDDREMLLLSLCQLTVSTTTIGVEHLQGEFAKLSTVTAGVQSEVFMHTMSRLGDTQSLRQDPDLAGEFRHMEELSRNADTIVRQERSPTTNDRPGRGFTL